MKIDWIRLITWIIIGYTSFIIWKFIIDAIKNAI